MAAFAAAAWTQGTKNRGTRQNANKRILSETADLIDKATPQMENVGVGCGLRTR